MPPLYQYPPPPVAGIKAEHQQPADNSPLKTRILDDNNDKKVEENGLDGCNKMVKESDSNRYLHKKFKKVATLEETSPGKAKGVLYPIPEDSQEVRPGSPGNGRYVCPFCKLSCAKPSVLQKHIRAHTNERPYPCLPCGFAFKTKSNLYKHCRSRAHTLKMDGQSSEEEEILPEVKKIYKPKFHLEELKMTNDVMQRTSCQQPYSSLSPSPESLQMHITKLINDNQAIMDESVWPKRRPSPSPPLRNGESKLALALTKAATPEPMEVDQQPLNLTVKEPRKRSLSETMISKGGSIIKDILLKTREKPDLSKMTDVILHPCPNCKVVFRTLENLNTHLFSCKPKSSPGPLLGKTPLVETFRDVKKRRVDFSSKFDDVKAKCVKLFGGEVQILDSPTGEAKTLRIDSRKEGTYVDPSSAKKDTQVLTISKTGLHSVGGTMIQSESVSPKPIYQEKLVLPILPNVAPPNVPGVATPVQLRFPSALNPLTSITAFNPLTLPPATLSPMKRSPSPYNGGVVTIYHAGKPIPFVQGIPGPNSLLATQPLIPKKPDKSVIVKPAPQKLEVKALTTPLRVDTEDRTTSNEDAKETHVKTEVGEKKFLRPSSLPLKPGTYTPKRSLTTPNAISLVSPETPRPRKSYGQLYLNGHAYTYLGLKCSTKMFFCTLNKPQPIYVPLSPDQYKISMYSNWKICSDSSPTPPGLDTRKAMSYYDSRNRHSNFTTANRNKQDLMTHSAFHTNRELRPESDKTFANGKNDDENESNPKRIKVCEGGFESNEDYIYVRGRGRGRYVCEECGIRCKKPSMLKKHIKTHTDLRPYTCKYCVFSFKTKGNLTKHMKSKAHYKKCVELDITPVPTSIEGYEDDTGSRHESDKFGPNGEDETDEETDEDEDEDEEDDDSVEDGDDFKNEREAARSLLSLSEVTLETAHRQYISAGLVSHSSRPRVYPYVRTSPTADDDALADRMMLSESWRRDLMLLTKDYLDLSIDSSSHGGSTESLVEASRPMDLSNKPLGCAKTSVITSVGGPIMMTALSPVLEKIPPSIPTPTTEYPEDSTLLHAYLTERAVRDSKMKQHQIYDRKSEDDDSPKKEEIIEEKFAKVSKLEPERIIRMPTPPVDSPCRSPPVSKLPDSPSKHLKAEFFPPSSGPALSYISTTEDGRSMCAMCKKVFNKPSQLRLHVNIHYFERPFRCEACAVSFRTKGHLQKHQRSLAHMNKVNMNTTFGTATTSNPRPFKCEDCKVAFRIHGHLAKHFRSKMHIMKLECLGKLPFGTYAELERSGVNMNDIDTTDCENSLESLQLLAMKLVEKDPSKVSSYEDSDGSGSKRLFSESSCGSEDESIGSKKNVSPPPPLLRLAVAKEATPSRFQTNIDKCNSNEDGVR